ncbi:MAG TPA: SRPBCC family protein [Acidimicrobiia bacterium]|nr:SRPBCC family protein [Acidimicrobiia bacterium]
MSVRIRVCTVIDAPPATVWDEVEHIERHSEWMADAHEIRFVGSRRSGVGTEFASLTRVGPLRTNDVAVVTEWEPRKAMGIVHRGVVTGTGRLTLRRKRGGRTRFCWEERLRFPWWMGGVVGERAAKPILKRIWRRNLRTLKARVES